MLSLKCNLFQWKGPWADSFHISYKPDCRVADCTSETWPGQSLFVDACFMRAGNDCANVGNLITVHPSPFTLMFGGSLFQSVQKCCQDFGLRVVVTWLFFYICNLRNEQLSSFVKHLRQNRRFRTESVHVFCLGLFHYLELGLSNVTVIWSYRSELLCVFVLVLTPYASSPQPLVSLPYCLDLNASSTWRIPPKFLLKSNAGLQTLRLTRIRIQLM